MSTSRQIRADQAGPITLDVDLSAGRINVTVDPACDRAVLVLATDDDTGPSADAIGKATVRQDGGTLAVRVPETPGGGSVTITGRGGSIQMNTFSGGTVITGNNVTMVNGRVVSGGTHVVVGGSEIVAAARLPVGSSLRAKTKSADIAAIGADLGHAQAQTMSGDVELRGATNVMVKTMSGDVTVSGLRGAASVSTMSGDVDVRALEQSALNATSMSGDVSYSGPIRFSGSSMSGRVRNR